MDLISNLNPTCIGDYSTIVLGFFLFISELMPFYKKNCIKDDTNVVDINGNIVNNAIEKQTSILHNSNGLLEIAITLLKKQK